jgi:hypothetical protein
VFTGLFVVERCPATVGRAVALRGFILLLGIMQLMEGLGEVKSTCVGEAEVTQVAVGSRIPSANGTLLWERKEYSKTLIY